MKVHVNLLPHRQQRRERARKHFFVLCGIVAVLGLAIVGAVHVYFANKLDAQAERNRFLDGEIAKLNKQIDEIKQLRAEIDALLARKQVIETLQTDRGQTVHLLDQLVRQVPEGVYLKLVRQRGQSVNLVGYAQSNARVSTLMRNIEASPWLGNPVLVEIKAVALNNQRLSEFNLNLSMKRAAPPPADEGGKPAAKKPAARKG